MNTGQKIKRYIWLVNVLRKRERLSLAELNELWVDEEVDEGNPLARTTLFRYRDAIMDMMGVEIGCDNYDRYYICNPDALENDQLQQWLLSSMTTQTVLSDSQSLHNRIILDDAPLGTEFLHPIILAMKQGRKLTLAYQKFKGEWSERTLSPYALRFCMHRWYLLCNTEKGMRIFALDRFDRLTVSKEKFSLPSDFSADDYFADFFGVLTDRSVAMEHVVIRAYGKTADFIRTLPIHRSQRVVAQSPDYTDYSFDIRPTADFIGQLFSYDEGVQVLEPESLRQQMMEKMKRMIIMHNA